MEVSRSVLVHADQLTLHRWISLDYTEPVNLDKMLGLPSELALSLFTPSPGGKATWNQLFDVYLHFYKRMDLMRSLKEENLSEVLDRDYKRTIGSVSEPFSAASVFHAHVARIISTDALREMIKLSWVALTPEMVDTGVRSSSLQAFAEEYITSFAGIVGVRLNF